MRKKMLVIATITILTICLISSFVFATSEGTMMRSTTNAIDDGGAVVGNTVEGAGDVVGNVVNDGGAMIGNAVEDGTEMISDNMVDGNTAIANGVIDSQTIENVGGDAKNAVDTMTTGNVLSGNSLSNYSILGVNLSVWMWIIIIIIIIVVIVLICNYMKQHNDNDYNDDDK